MGYARASQTGHGIHQRLRARAFIMSELPSATATTAEYADEDDDNVEEEAAEVNRLRRNDRRHGYLQQQRLKESLQLPPLTTETTMSNKATHTADPNKTVCFVSIDAGMGSDLLNQRVLKRLEELLPPDAQEDSDSDSASDSRRLCRLENLSISGTHTHSAPGGFLQYTLYQITSKGFSEQVMQIYTEGVAQAILRAYENLQPGSIGMAQSYLLDANINRSPSSYLLNPPEERAEYADQGDTDKTMLQLLFTSTSSAAEQQQQRPMGVLNWFAVHGTSMNSSNVLISGDNKGYASYLMEKHYNDNATLPGQGSFVAAFASTNLGDISPNTAGPRCIDTGLPCDFTTSTCGGSTKNCIAFGPGKDMFESTEIIGRLQYEHAVELATDSKKETLKGEIDYRHSFIDMSGLNVTLEDGQLVQTCPAALGYSFAAGTTDGPGDFDFTQGLNSSNPFWNMLRGFLSTPSKEQIQCHHPKPILLNTGQVSLPYDWDPSIVPISIFRIGQLFLLSVPAEFTTMAGRRLRRAVRQVLVDGGFENPVITIAGLANSYTHYVTTFEEYAGQRYEAASTLYGPHTLSAYIQEFERITSDLVQGMPSLTGESPPDLSRKQISLIPPVGLDLIGFGKKYGSVAVNANDEYGRGDTVAVSFRSANPRNNQRIEDTFLTVDRLNDDGSWTTIYVDGDWCTKFYWKGGGLEHFATSFAEIYWKIPNETIQGLYRICHFGTRKTLLAQVELALITAPDWLTSNLLGSAAVSMMLINVELAIAVSGRVRGWFESVGGPRLKEFHGCSRTFLVRSDPGI
jgi:neutral ceramidase